MNKVYYSQIDQRWANHTYPSQQLPYATIGSGGCGAACAAMVVSMLKEIITPDAMGDIFVKDGIRVNGGTSNRAFDSYLTEKYGLKVQRKWKIAEAKECLENGGLVVARCTDNKGTLFTTGGHFIVLVGFKNNEFEIYDPYLYKTKFEISYRKGKARVEGTSVFVTFENMKAYGGYNELWCYEGTGVDTNIDTSIPVVPEIKTEKYKVVNVRTSSCLNVRSGAGTNYSIVERLFLNNEVDVYEIVGNWAKIGEGKWVCTDYINKIQNVDSYNIMTVTAKTGLNVRQGPGTNYNRVTCYKYGTKVKVFSIENGWAKGTKGYMYATYLK